MNLRFSLIVAIIVLSSVAFIGQSNAQVSPENFEKTVSGGESFSVNFAVFNDRNESLFYSVILPISDGWEIKSEHPSGILKPGSAREVIVNFIAPRVSTKKDWHFNIVIDFYNSTKLVESSSINVIVHFKVHLFESFYFHIPFPEAWGYWGNFLNALIFWAVVGFVVYVVFAVLKRAVKITKTKVDDSLLSILHAPTVLWIILYGIYSSVLLFPLPTDFISYVYLIYNVLTILIVTWIMYRIYRDLIIHYAFRFRKKMGKMESAMISALEKVGIATILGIGGIMILQAFGVDVTVLLASMGVLGIILGFAAQDTMANFFSGIHILLDRSVEVGDYIILENDEKVYKVRDVGLRSTKLYDIFGNTIIYIPNNIIANHKITNLTRPDTKLELRIDVGVSYKSDIKKVRETLLQVAYENPHVLKDGKYKPNVVFREFGSSSLNFTLYVWIDNLVDQWIVMSTIREKIVEKFREREIEIPYQQVDVHIKR